MHSCLPCNCLICKARILAMLGTSLAPSIYLGSIVHAKYAPHMLTKTNYHHPYKNLEHALRTLYTQFAFVLHSFCALVNHILHMYKMCVTSKILGTCAKCAQEVYIAICVQFAHNPQDMCTICAVCAHN